LTIVSQRTDPQLSVISEAYVCWLKA
jgi:hypothetical protein